MVNYVLSFCKITGASRIFSRNFYLPLLKPLTPKEALRTLRITGKWLLGAKIQHYIPVLLNHKKKRSKKVKNFGKKPHREMEDYTYMTPVLDADNDNHKLLLAILDEKPNKGAYVYQVDDKKYNIVLQAQLERAIIDGDVIDVLVSQRNDKIIVKLNTMKKIPIEIQYYDPDDVDGEKLYCGEGATSPEDEKFHHHGKYTMSLAKIFEEKELLEEKWEEELRRIMRKRKRQAREGSKEWKAMIKESIKNLDWEKFEQDAKKIIDEIDEPAEEQEIEMEIDQLESTLKVNETILKHELLDQLPTMTEIPEIIKNMGSATLDEIEDGVEDDSSTTRRRVSGVRVTLPSGKECFISGQMVHTEDGDVFVPGQTIENEFGLEYAPGITINVNNKPTLINGLIMGEEARDPMFLPTQSTITADGQLTFASTPEERPKLTPEALEKKMLKKKKLVEQPMIEEFEDDDEDVESAQSEDNFSSSVELNNSEFEELDSEAYRLKQEQQRLEIEKLKSFLLDDGLEDLVASIEEKRAKLEQKLEELRRLSTNPTGNNPVSYISESDTLEIASRLTQDKETINRLGDILTTMIRRAATFRDKNNIKTANINQAYISVTNLSETDTKFNNAPHKLKIMLKTALVAANEVFLTRPKDEVMALSAIADIIQEIDPKTLEDLLNLMQTPWERNEMCNAIYKQLTQNISQTKISFVNDLAGSLSIYDVITNVEKVLKSEPQCEAFIKIAKLAPEILTQTIKSQLGRIKTEEDAVETLQLAIQDTSVKLTKQTLPEVINDPNFKLEASSFAKALGATSSEEIITETTNLGLVSDKRTLELLERVVLIQQLASRDYSLKSAIERLKKSPERARNDPRIRQLIRESALLLPSGPKLRNSRDLPSILIKNQNLLALEDLLIQKSKIEFPVLITRNNIDVIIPKDASNGVLTGRVSYTLINESGVTKMFSNSERKNSVAENSWDKLSNVRLMNKKLFSSDSRQVA